MCITKRNPIGVLKDYLNGTGIIAYRIEVCLPTFPITYFGSNTSVDYLNLFTRGGLEQGNNLFTYYCTCCKKKHKKKCNRF